MWTTYSKAGLLLHLWSLPCALAADFVMYPYDEDAWAAKDGDSAVCKTGIKQSPIDLQHTLPLPGFDMRMTALPVNWESSVAGVKVGGVKSRNGHSLTYSIPTANQASNTLTKDGKEYRMLQFHIHTGSEHTVEGKQYAAEIHYVHSEKDVAPGEVLTASGDLAVVGINFELWEGSGTEPASVGQLATLLADLPNDESWGEEDQKDVSGNVDVAAFLDLISNKRRYWTYEGSLTTPPCTETVKWHVMMDPLYITQAQVDQIELISGEPNNFRPPQDLHGRVQHPPPRVVSWEIPYYYNSPGPIASVSAATLALASLVVALL